MGLPERNDGRTCPSTLTASPKGRFNRGVSIFQGAWRRLRRNPRAIPRVVPLLALLVGVPGIVMAYFAALSVRSEALAARAQFQERCERVAADLYREVESRFADIETPILKAIDQGGETWIRDPALAADPLLAAHPDIDGLLILDANHSIVHPPAGHILAEDAATRRGGDVDRSFMGETFRIAEEAEIQDGDPVRAAELYARAIGSIPGERGKAIARNALARSLLKASRPAEARAVWERIAAENSPDQDWNGIPLNLLARHQSAVAMEAEGKHAEADRARASLLRDLTTFGNWTYGGFAEAVLASRIVEHFAGNSHTSLDKRPDLDSARLFLERARRRQVNQELTLRLLSVLREDAPAPGEPRIRYLRQSLGSQRVLVARTRWASKGVKRQFLFTLDEDHILAPLHQRIAGATQANPELLVRLTEVQAGPLPLRSPSEGAVYPLEPWVPGTVLVVGRGDSSHTEAMATRERRLRLGMVGAFTLLILLGALVTARAVLREMEIARLRTDFVSNVSHELRTPITTIRLMGEMLAMGAVPTEDKRMQYYQTIVSESERLSRLINNVLDFARIEEGRKKFRFAPGNVGDCARQVEKITTDYVRGEGFVFEVEVAPDLPSTWFDADALVQALVNLVSNAVKYSKDHKHIRLTARREMDSVVLEVKDRGEGIDAKDLRHIFDKFYRGGDTLTRDTRGAGLGLAIVKAIVDAHSGTIRVDSKKGEGSTFAIVLPLRTQPPGPVVTQPKERGADS